MHDNTIDLEIFQIYGIIVIEYVSICICTCMCSHSVAEVARWCRDR